MRWGINFKNGVKSQRNYQNNKLTTQTNLCLVVLLLLAIGALQAQNKEQVFNIEKTYVHTDRSTYFIGEDLWYKAYNVDAFSNLLSNTSNVLYVELIAPDSKIIARNKTNLEMGLGHGDFKLTDSVGVKSGVYQLRAYTNWNRNFGEDFVFKKTIEIIDVFEAYFNKKDISESPKTEEKERTNQTTFIIDFFPEGGSLLENVTSVVGFKAVDAQGNPIQVSGEIYDSDNQEVTTFSSVHDGMGKFQIIPIKGNQYYAKVRTQTGEEQTKPFPKVLKQGYLLSFKTLKGKNILSVNTNQETLLQNPNQEIKVTCRSKGISYLEFLKTISETTVSFALPKDRLADGISQITLSDSQLQPQSERLVFIEKDHDLDVHLKTDKSSYKPNENAVISLSFTSKTGKVKSGSYSLSVTDMNGEDDHDYGTNISSYFLMESDIRGYVHDPSYYFNTNNSKRLVHLDNLLLTQGWRDFLWKIAPRQKDSIIYKAEKGFTVSGRVKHVFGKTSLINSNVTLGLTSKHGFNAFSTQTDSLGEYKFEDLVFYGKTNLHLNSRNDKGKYRGFMVLDSVGQQPMQINYKNTALNVLKTAQRLVEHVYKKYTVFGVPPENILDEVEIIGEKTSNLDIFYGVSDYRFVADENTKNLATIYDVLDKVPGLLVVGNTVSIPGESGSPLILVDDYFEGGGVDFVYPSEVVKIEVIRASEMLIPIYGESARGGIISIITNGKSRGNKPKKVPVHSINKVVEGFYEARVFFSPEPKTDDLEDKDRAVRNTLYWNPYVHPDKEGKTTVNYFNTNVETKVKVTLEGITTTGVPVVKKTSYVIQK